MKIVLDLTDEEIEKLEEILIDHCDEGPRGYGWRSDIMLRLSEKVEKSIEADKS